VNVSYPGFGYKDAAIVCTEKETLTLYKFNSKGKIKALFYSPEFKSLHKI
jgi:hypothetical protein